MYAGGIRPARERVSSASIPWSPAQFRTHRRQSAPCTSVCSNGITSLSDRMSPLKPSPCPLPVWAKLLAMSPREIGSRRVEKLVLIRLLPLAIGISILLRVDAIWYVCGVALMARVVELIPYWQYKEKTFVPVAQVELHARAQAAAHAASLENS